MSNSYKPSALRFSIPGKPQGKKRVGRNKQGKAYNPTAEYEKHVAMFAMEAYSQLSFEKRIEWPTKKQVFMDVWIYHDLTDLRKKPDSGNVIKAIEDALSGTRKRSFYLWKDDKHVLSRPQGEYWPDDNPRVDVAIWFTGYMPGKKGLERCE